MKVFIDRYWIILLVVFGLIAFSLVVAVISSPIEGKGQLFIKSLLEGGVSNLVVAIFGLCGLVYVQDRFDVRQQKEHEKQREYEIQKEMRDAILEISNISSCVTELAGRVMVAYEASNKFVEATKRDDEAQKLPYALRTDLETKKEMDLAREEFIKRQDLAEQQYVEVSTLMFNATSKVRLFFDDHIDDWQSHIFRTLPEVPDYREEQDIEQLGILYRDFNQRIYVYCNHLMRDYDVCL